MTEPTGRELAEIGIRESHEHAEQVSADWTRRAVEKVGEYAHLHGEFLTEELKGWAYQSGLEQPSVDGAWGAVMRTAAARGIVHSAGKKEARSPGAHGKLMTLWRRGFKEQAVKPTHKQVHDMAAALGRFAVQMRKEGRAIFAEQLLEAEKMLKDLVA